MEKQHLEIFVCTANGLTQGNVNVSAWSRGWGLPTPLRSHCVYVYLYVFVHRDVSEGLINGECRSLVSLGAALGWWVHTSKRLSSSWSDNTGAQGAVGILCSV